MPSPEQAQALLKTQPELVEQLRERLSRSGLTPDQVRSRLRAAGYPENMLDDYVQGADTTVAAQFGPRTLDAVRALGVLTSDEADSLRLVDSVGATSDSLRAVLDSIQMLRADSARADSLADSVAVLRGAGLKLFGVETFRRATTRFQPAQSGPGGPELSARPGRPARPHPHRRRRALAHPRSHPRRLRRHPAGRPGLRRQPHAGAARGSALRPARPGVLRRAARPERHHPVPAVDRAAPDHPGLRRGRRGPARRVPDVERRHGADRALRRGRPDHQRELPVRPDPARPSAGGQPRPLRLPAPRQQPHRHPAPERRRGLRPGPRGPGDGHRQGPAPGDLRGAPHRDAAGCDRVRRRIRIPAQRRPG